MNEHTDGNAMTEVALALAMAFFSIMVLAMVGMSMPSQSVAQSAGVATAPPALDAPDPARLQEQPADHPADAADPATAAPAEQLFVLYFNGEFFDIDGQRLDLTALRADQPVVLAVSPDLNIAETLAVKAKISVADPVITTLNEDWINHLESQS
mgnify:CR=1 FL=1